MHTVKFKPTLSYATHSHMHTVGLVITTSSFFFLRVLPGLMSPTWPLDPLLGWLLLLPTQPSVCETFRSLRFNLSLSYTDTHLYVFSLDLHGTLIINNIIRKWSSWTLVSTQKGCHCGSSSVCEELITQASNIHVFETVTMFVFQSDHDLMSWREIVRCGGGGWTCHGSPGWGSSIWRVVSEWRVVRDGEWSMFDGRTGESWTLIISWISQLKSSTSILYFCLRWMKYPTTKWTPRALFQDLIRYFPINVFMLGYVHGRGHPAILQTGKSPDPVVGAINPTKIFLFYFIF